jgi:uncharacterized protein (DUF2336 family)
MSEHQSALGQTEMAIAAVVTKPRISADAFRNLTARLKKADVVVPDISPVVVAVQNSMPVFVPEVISVQEIVAEPIAPTPAFEVRVEPVFETISPVEFIAPETAPEIHIETVFESISPVGDILEIAAEPVLEAIVAEPDVVLDLPAALPEFEPIVPHFDIVPVAEVAVAADMASLEPQLEGSFAENFTYVPEAGKEDLPLDLTEIDEAVKREVAERAVELELENIWRLLLAKPTAEDRSQYLREAGNYAVEDDDMLRPAPEFDLSRIEPAVLDDAAFPPTVKINETPVSVDILPVAEGQDLAELTRSLLDMMASGNASGQPQERALAADTLLRLVPRLELKPLIMLAQRLAMMDNPPHLLAARLIRDPRVEVAGPLLEDCPHLTDKDLESVVQDGEPAKLRMVARRRKLTRPISDALIKSGDPSVVLTLVRNMEAEISHDGFQSLLVLCERNEELLAPLATRHDFQAPFAFELFWLAPAQLRRFILSRFLTDSETLTKILKITMATQSEDETEIEPLSQHALLEGLERAARGHVEVAAEELSVLMQVSTATMTRILGDLQGDAIVVMLKAAGYPRSSVSGLLKRMQDADLPLVTRERDVTELQTMFETMSFNKARILLTYWDWAQGKTGPYAPVH